VEGNWWHFGITIMTGIFLISVCELAKRPRGCFNEGKGESRFRPVAASLDANEINETKEGRRIGDADDDWEVAGDTTRRRREDDAGTISKKHPLFFC
jgi:hypothetical protein